jgi:hypothetical protein
MRISYLEIVILLVFISGVAIVWADVYRLHDQIQTLRNENELMISEIEHKYKLIVAMDKKLYPIVSMPGK